MTEDSSLLILRDLVKPKKEIETHISHVLLTDDYVYKLKKKVDFGFLNFKLSKDRKRFCILEKELNQRFCQNVYEDALKIARRGSEFVLVPATSTLTAVDYVVKMKRIPEKDFLKNRIEKGEVSQDNAREIGQQTAELFQNIETSVEAAEENGGYKTVRYNCEENFQQTEKYSGTLIDSKYYDFIKKKTLDFLDNNQNIFTNRVSGGYVKDGHGDLRLEHIFFQNQKVGLMDCIEFNRRMRFNDVISDFVFLCTELDQIGKYELSDAFLEGFLSVYDDEDSQKLINFYKCYRAFVRAKVTCFLLEEKGENWENYTQKKEELNRLMELSLTYSINMDGVKTLLFTGLMGTGKSKNAKAFVKKYPGRLLSTDYYRKITAGLDPKSKIYDEYGKGLYSKENSQKLYKKLGEIACKYSKLGRMTVVDGSFSKNDFLEIFRNDNNLHIIKLKFTADEDEIIKRLQKRLSKSSVSDGRPEIFDKQMKSAEDIGAGLVVDTTEAAVDDNLIKIENFLIDEA
ncbi:AAA family ATPase [Flexistipes sinusarabici]|uniref:bifunctional aminoglycoside phosphotransferase/ATP-binding protein n=1 Tax=Flexistipes sinusarabici TaxID=2352 RepID=UPI0023524030|nr:AAA family ATPase [Flexistipes sinusarabici]